MVPDTLIREAWLRAEALCECQKQKHGHTSRCNQFLIWEDQGGTGQGAWELRFLNDPRRPACEILCAACYAKATGEIPMRMRLAEGSLSEVMILNGSALEVPPKGVDHVQDQTDQGIRGCKARQARRARRRTRSDPSAQRG